MVETRGETQEWAEYGAHLLSDFPFSHVVSQIFIIHVHDVRSWYYSFGLAGNLHVKRRCKEIVKAKLGSQGDA